MRGREDASEFPGAEHRRTSINRIRLAAAAVAVTIPLLIAPPATASTTHPTARPATATAVTGLPRLLPPATLPVLPPTAAGVAPARDIAPQLAAAQPRAVRHHVVRIVRAATAGHTRPAARRAAPAVRWTPAGAGAARTVVAAALAQVGDPYRWGADGPDAWDCSGLVKGAFARTGMTLPHQSGAIAGMGRPVPRSQWQPGTVITYPGHVALYIGGNLMVEAPHPGARVRVVPVRPGAGRWLFGG